MRIINYELDNSWILSKFALKMHECLDRLGRENDIGGSGTPEADVAHHINYAGAEEKFSTIETLMITHLDSVEKVNDVTQKLRVFDMGVCMSSETRERLVSLGMPREKLCYVNPAHDGRIAPRPLVLGIAARNYSDGRKKGYELYRALVGLPAGAFALKIMGGGWGDIVDGLRASGFSVEYYEDFVYDVYVDSFMPSLDYFLYLGWDEGAMGFIDALAAGVKTIVTPQGYHLDIPEAIDHVISDAGDLRYILSGIHRERQEKIGRVQAWTWDEYAWRHVLVWDYLRLKDAPAVLAEYRVFMKLIPKIAPAEHGVMVPDLHLPVPPEHCLWTASEKAAQGGLEALSRLYLLQSLVFYPKNSLARKKLLRLYPEYRV